MASHTQVVVFEMLGSCSIDMVAVTLGAEILVRDMQFFDIGHNDYPVSLSSLLTFLSIALARAILGGVGLVSKTMTWLLKWFCILSIWSLLDRFITMLSSVWTI